MPSALADKLKNQQALQAAGKSQSQVIDLLQDRKVTEQIALALPASLKADRFMRVVLTTVRTNPKLLECSRDSFLAALFLSAQLGLEPGPLGLIYYVPFRNRQLGTTEITPIIGYRGLINLARRSGEILSIKARPVFERDKFDYEEGLVDKLQHTPFLGDDRGQLLYFYAVSTFLNGGHALRVMTKADVDKIRNSSRAKDDGPWVSHYPEMGGKTVLRQLANRGELPLTIEAAEALAEDERRELGIQTSEAVDLGALRLPSLDGEEEGEKSEPEKAAPMTDRPKDATNVGETSAKEPKDQKKEAPSDASGTIGETAEKPEVAEVKAAKAKTGAPDESDADKAARKKRDELQQQKLVD